MTTAFAPIDMSTVAEPVDLADTLTEHPHTPEFNQVIADFATTVEGLRTQQWPAVASEDAEGAQDSEEAEANQEAEETESLGQPEEAPSPEAAPAPAEEAPIEETEAADLSTEAAE
jgi:hypothetical protein